MPACPKCGHLNPDYSRFCQSCGASLGPESFGQYHPSTTPSARQGISDVQKIIIVVAVILVVIIVVGAITASFLLSLNSVSRTSSLSAPIVITGVNAQMSYANPSATYFGPQTQSSSPPIEPTHDPRESPLIFTVGGSLTQFDCTSSEQRVPRKQA